MGLKNHISIKPFMFLPTCEPIAKAMGLASLREYVDSHDKPSLVAYMVKRVIRFHNPKSSLAYAVIHLNHNVYNAFYSQ